MYPKEIKIEILNLEKEILALLESNVEYFIIEDRAIPMFSIVQEVQLEKLLMLHIKVNDLLDYSRKFIEVERQSFDKIIHKCLLLKSHIESLVQLHPEFSHKKYPKQFKHNWNLKKGGTHITIKKSLVSHPTKFIKSLYHLTLKKGIISSCSSQRKAFVSLFHPFKSEERLEWGGPVYSLKRFFDTLDELKIIDKPTHFEKFISQSCLTLNLKGEYTEFKPNTFKVSSHKVEYNKIYYDWKEIESLL